LNNHPVLSGSVSVVGRHEIRAISSCQFDEQLHLLGEHRDFRRHGGLKGFLPNEGRHSFSWVRLRDGEVLDVHTHPTKSMIIVCQGSVLLTGDAEQLLSEGDTVCVPAGRPHGFCTHPGQVFHGLSIQFEGEGLYEDEGVPRVEFVETDSCSFRELKAFNERQLQIHGRNRLFQLFASDVLNSDGARRRQFLEALYVWSCYFQKMIYARGALCTNKALQPIYAEHLREEFGHDEMLRAEHQLEGTAYDAILEAASQWFIAKMLTCDEAEKIVVVHMVVESSGHLFGEHSKEIFKRAPDTVEDSYFEVHSEADEDHSAIGLDYLQRLSPCEFPKLMETCRQAWDQMNLVHERIAAMAMMESSAITGD